MFLFLDIGCPNGLNSCCFHPKDSKPWYIPFVIFDPVERITHDHSIIGTANDKSYAALSQILPKECVELFKRNDVHLIVKVSVVCTGDNEQFLVIAGQLAVRCFAEIAGVRLFPVYQQHGRADFAAVLQDRHLQERQRGRHVPAAVGVQTAGMVSFIISPYWNML